MSKIILITGCSTGTGCNLAERSGQAGYTVVATARNVRTLADSRVALKLPLDVTQPDTIQEAVGQIIQRYGRIDVLINNAGYAVRGAGEEVPVDKAQQKFDMKKGVINQ